MFAFNTTTYLLIFVIEILISGLLYVIVRRRIKHQATSIKPPF